MTRAVDRMDTSFQEVGHYREVSKLPYLNYEACVQIKFTILNLTAVISYSEQRRKCHLGTVNNSKDQLLLDQKEKRVPNIRCTQSILFYLNIIPEGSKSYILRTINPVILRLIVIINIFTDPCLSVIDPLSAIDPACNTEEVCKKGTGVDYTCRSKYNQICGFVAVCVF